MRSGNDTLRCCDRTASNDWTSSARSIIAWLKRKFNVVQNDRYAAAKTVVSSVSIENARSGFPEAAALTLPRTRERWLASYIDEVVTRDVKISNSEVRDPIRLRRYLQACAANTAGIVEHKTLFDTAQVSRITGPTR